jgi:para-aminobenzoate synthetase component 1
MTHNITEWPYKDPVLDFAALADEPYAFLFDGKCGNDPRSRYSYICWAPEEVLEVKTGYEGNPFDALRVLQEKYKDGFAADPNLPPFQGGLAGFFGYDLGRYLETLPSDLPFDSKLPDMVVGVYKNVITYDHTKKKAWCMGQHPPAAKPLPPYLPAPLDWQEDCDEDTYIEKIKKAIDYIYAGEIYQVNVSRRFTAALPKAFDSFAHYMHLREVNAAPFSAYLNCGDVVLSSSSPEQFLECKEGQVETRPIKGTLPSTRKKEELLNSDKDKAENLMIVDLLRNDISKSCAPHSVKVPELFSVETFKGLHHLVSAVTGTLKEDKDSIDLLEGCFPGGSITGAPKIRAMEVIEELEEARRGHYCGAIGVIGFDGYMQTSIAIRTLVYTGGTVQLQTGGGIVADSSAAAELQETLDKAHKMFESFEHAKEDAA